MTKFYTLLCFLFLFVGTQAQNFKFGQVSEEEVLEKSHPIEKEANAAVLFREISTYYEFNKNTGFTLVTDVHERIKIYNKDGFNWASKEVNYYQDGTTREKLVRLKGNTFNIVKGKLVKDKLKKDGIFKEDVDKYSLKTNFTMPAVTEGSVIEFSYSLRSPFVISIDDIELQYTIPINNLESRVSIPEFLIFQKHFNSKSPLAFSIAEGRKNFRYSSEVEYHQNTYTISKTDIPSLKKEPFIDYLSGYAAFLKWELQYTKFPNSSIENFSQDWAAVSKGIFKDGGYDRELSRTRYFEKDIDQLLDGVQDQTKKAELIYAFVKNKVKWNNFFGYQAENGCRSAYKDGQGNIGDINLMLTAMLKYAGLNANPVLLSTRNNGTPIFPTRKGFNYVVSGLQLQDQIILLDATDANTSFGDLPGRARNWQGRLIVDGENSDWVDLMPKYKSVNKHTLNFQFDDELKLKGKSITILKGLFAKSFRDSYGGMNEDSYISTLEENKGNIIISNLEITNERKIGEDINETYEFELENGVEVINDKMYLKPLLFLAQNENPFKADERQYPIFFDFPSVNEKTVNIIIPEGYEVESLPENIIIELNGSAGIFKFVVVQNGKFLRVASELDLKNIVFTSTDYEILKEFYAQMVEKHSEAIVLAKS